MKRYLLLFAALYMVTAGHAQKKNFSYKFYGQVRGDLFYNSRANAEIVDGYSTFILKTRIWMPMVMT